MCIGAFMGAFFKWFIDGQLVFSLFERPVKQKSIDAFGEEIITTVWKEDFQMGLDFAVPIMITAIFLTVFLGRKLSTLKN